MIAPGQDPEVLAAFVDESLDSVTRLRTAVADARRGGGPEDLVNRLFRGLHTVKGSSAFLELTPITTLAHAAEDLISGARDAKRALTSAQLELVDRALETLEQLISTDEAVAVEPLIAALRGAPAVEERAHAPVPPVAEAPVAHGPVHEGKEVILRIRRGVLDEALERIGEIVASVQAAEAPRGGRTARRRALTLARAAQRQLQQAARAPVRTALEAAAEIARDVAERTGKGVQVRIDAAPVWIDRMILDALREPLLHLVRNAVDHGVESTGRRLEHGKPPRAELRLAAHAEERALVVTVRDDGAGMDPVKLRATAVARGWMTEREAALAPLPRLHALIFHPGFSTKDAVTAISGRGVGLDVVRERLGQLGGEVRVESVARQGTTFTLTLPGAVDRVPAVVLRAGGGRWAVPAEVLREVVYLDGAQSRVLRATGTFPCEAHVERRTLTLHALPGAAAAFAGDGGSCAAILEGKGTHALWADDVSGVTDVTLRRAPSLLPLQDGWAITDDGLVLPLLAPAGLAAA